MFIVYLLFLYPTSVELDFQNQFVVWNIGQGQWVTVIDSKHCYHFDVGGEFYNPTKISKSCAKKENVIFYSHWDWDHIGLTAKLKHSVKSVCIAQMPQGTAVDYKKKILNRLPQCQKQFPKITKLNFTYKTPKNDNDLSKIFIYNKKLLIPGDSTKKMEKIWSPLIPQKIKWLLVSHHGSKTSTSEELLKHRTFTQAIVSARKQVYGHPHKIIMERLKKHKIPVLKTEDWGNIHVIMN